MSEKRKKLPRDVSRELENLKSSGISLPRNYKARVAAADDYRQMLSNPGQLQNDVKAVFDKKASPEVQSIQKNAEIISAMRRHRTASGRTGMTRLGSMGSDVMAAVPRFYDPMEYWDLSGLPWNMADEGHRHKLHKWMRLYYSTHYLVRQCVEIYARFPLAGIRIHTQDKKVTQFYEEEFLDKLDYEDFLYKVGREVFCALPGEMVQTISGPKPIEEVDRGELVLTHEGRYRMVTRTLSKGYEGEYVTLRPHYCEPIRYTTGHEILAMRDGEKSWMPIEDVKTTDYVFVPTSSLVVDRSAVSPWEYLDKQEWIEVCEREDLQIDEIPDYINWTESLAKYTSWRARECERQIKKGVPVGSVLRRNRRFSQGTSPLAGSFEITPQLMRLFGLYIAEGCTGNGGASNVKDVRPGDANEVQWAFHEDETEYIQFVIDAVRDIFGLRAYTQNQKDTRGTKVIVHSIPLAHWFKEMFGHLAENKRIPDWALHLPTHKVAPLLRGYFEGDGSQSDRRLRATSTSQTLSSQVNYLVRRMGYVSRHASHDMSKYNRKAARSFQSGPCDAQFRNFLEQIDYELDRDLRPAVFEDPVLAIPSDNGYWVKVFKTEASDYSGPVYDLTVDEDESFVSGCIAVHNCVGEAFPLGSFNESLGVWEREELLNPENIVIEQFPLMGTQQFKVHLPESLRKLAQTKSPPDEYKQLQINYEQLIPYALRGEPFPVSDVMLKQVGTRYTDWDDHGTPIMLGALRTLLHEEKLLASQDAIAERLYSPLILAKLGSSDMGGDYGPWLPTPDQLDGFRDDLDIALASDFRLLVHHFALEVSNVFGREQVPDLGGDFDRIERRLLQAFGIAPSLLAGGSNAQPYASSALQAEFMNQQMKTYQNQLKQLFWERAQVVAEAQGHFAYEKRGQTRVPIMQEVIDYDEEGNPFITEKHKMMDIELQFENFNMRDEATERQFLQTLRSMGVPISDNKMMINVGFDFKDSLDELSEEMIQKTVVQQQAKLQTYKILQTQGLPIPPDLKAEVESTNAPVAPAGGGMSPGGAPPGGIGDMSMPGAVDVGAPSPSGGGGIVMPPPPPGLEGAAPPIPGGSSGPDGSMGTRPPISDEMRSGMPKPVGASFAELDPEEVDKRLAGLNETLVQLEIKKRDRRVKEASRRTYVDPSEPELKWDLKHSSRVVEDKVPPAFRRKIQG